jgi:hypothetical protein
VKDMKVGAWIYGLGTVLTGVLNLVWGAFDASHQPIQSVGKSLAGHPSLAYAAGIWLIAAGLAMFWRQSERLGAAACAAGYLMFAALWLCQYAAGIHAYGWRAAVLFGVSFGLAQQVMLAAPGILISFAASPDALVQRRVTVAARWMLGFPPVIFGLFHLVALRIFAGIVPHWMGFGYFWAAFTGIAFFVAGCAICSGVMDVLAAKLLAWMLLLFEFLVEIPPIFGRLHHQPTWGAAVYNVTAVGACWILVEFLANRAEEERKGSVAALHSNPMVA